MSLNCLVYLLKMIKISLDVKQSVIFSVIVVKNINILIDIVTNQDISLELLFFTCMYSFYEILFCIYMLVKTQTHYINLEFFSLCGVIINSIILRIMYVLQYNTREIKLCLINVVVYILFYFSFITLSKSIRLYKVTKEDIDRYSNECVICLEDMCIKSNYLQKLKCNHVFHKDCISKYVGYNINLEELRCPTCRC
jgi:hypothetical protein